MLITGFLLRQSDMNSSQAMDLLLVGYNIGGLDMMQHLQHVLQSTLFDKDFDSFFFLILVPKGRKKPMMETSMMEAAILPPEVAQSALKHHDLGHLPTLSQVYRGQS